MNGKIRVGQKAFGVAHLDVQDEIAECSASAGFDQALHVDAAVTEMRRGAFNSHYGQILIDIPQNRDNVKCSAPGIFCAKICQMVLDDLKTHEFKEKF